MQLLLISFPALSIWGSPRQKGLCSHLALFWAPDVARVKRPFLIFLPHAELWGPLRQQGLYSHFAYFWGPEPAGVQ